MTNFKFYKTHRLLTAEDFLYLKKGSSSIKAPYVIAYIKKTRLDSTLTRLGISISKKVGNSCRRNRLKRIIREIFRVSDARFQAVDVLIVVTPNITNAGIEADKIFVKSLQKIFNSLQKQE